MPVTLALTQTIPFMETFLTKLDILSLTGAHTHNFSRWVSHKTPCKTLLKKVCHSFLVLLEIIEEYPQKLDNPSQ